MAASKHFTVTIGVNGSTKVTAFRGMDTGPDVMFNKVELEKELEELMQEAFRSGRRVGRGLLQDELKDLLGIERPA